MSDKLILTTRQREVLGLVAQGETRGAIALKLGMNIPTVASHLDHMRKANHADTTAQLCYLLGLEEGRIPVAGSVTMTGGEVPGPVASTVNREGGRYMV